MDKAAVIAFLASETGREVLSEIVIFALQRLKKLEILDDPMDEADADALIDRIIEALRNGIQ